MRGLTPEDMQQAYLEVFPNGCHIPPITVVFCQTIERLLREKNNVDRYFCQRCGKRIGDKTGVWEGVHTCTPPSDL